MKKIKDLIKKNPEPARGTNYVNPSQLGQYSATNQVSESALDDYLSSRGIDTAHLSTPTKIAHSKSNAFLKWKRDHMKEDRTMDPGPTEKKASKLNTATSVQKVVKTPPGPGSHHEAKGSQMTALTPEEVVYEDKKPKMTALDRFRKASDEREKKHKETEKNSGGMTSAIDRLQKHMNKEEVEHLNEDETLKAIANKHGMKYHPGTYGANMSHPTKGYVNVNRYGEWGHYKQGRFDRGHGSATAHGDSSQHFKDLDKHLSSLKEASPAKNQDVADKAYLKHKPGTVKGQLTQIGRFLRGKPEIKESNDSHTHAAHYENDKGEWTGMNLFTAKDDDDAIKQAQAKCKEGCRLSRVERHTTVKEAVEVETEKSIEKHKITTDMLSGRVRGGKLNSFKNFKVDLVTSGEETIPADTDEGEDTREKQKITTNPGPVDVKLDDKLTGPTPYTHFSSEHQITHEEVQMDEKVIAGTPGWEKMKKNVKDKSGAIHTPMSRARDLARKSFSKLKKETMMGKISN